MIGQSLVEQGRKLRVMPFNQSKHGTLAGQTKWIMFSGSCQEVLNDGSGLRACAVSQRWLYLGVMLSWWVRISRARGAHFHKLFFMWPQSRKTCHVFRTDWVLWGHCWHDTSRTQPLVQFLKTTVSVLSTLIKVKMLAMHCTQREKGHEKGPV